MVWPFSSSLATKADETALPSACPVDPSTRQAWLTANNDPPPSATAPRPPADASRLSTAREVSSIPRWLPSSTSAPASAQDAALPTACPARSAEVPSGSSSPSPAAAPSPAPAAASDTPPATRQENWVYPSPSSFYTALQRKNREPTTKDMPIVVPIHNAVNERVWAQVLEWEREAARAEGRDEERVESKLVSFVGKPKELSPRARWKSLIGYTAPFDRHDWIVDRPLPASPPSSSSPPTPSSIRIRYIIDFYTGRLPALLSPDQGAPPSAPGAEEHFRPNLAFFIDVRPALDGWEGVRMRAGRYWRSWVGEKRGAEAEGRNGRGGA